MRVYAVMDDVQARPSSADVREKGRDRGLIQVEIQQQPSCRLTWWCEHPTVGRIMRVPFARVFQRGNRGSVGFDPGRPDTRDSVRQDEAKNGTDSQRARGRKQRVRACGAGLTLAPFEDTKTGNDIGLLLIAQSAIGADRFPAQGRDFQLQPARRDRRRSRNAALPLPI